MFTDASVLVLVDGVVHFPFLVKNDSIHFTLQQLSRTGQVSVKVMLNSSTIPGSVFLEFTEIPQFAIAPSIAPRGSLILVTVSGFNLNRHFTYRVDGLPVNVTYVSDTKVLAILPMLSSNSSVFSVGSVDAFILTSNSNMFEVDFFSPQHAVVGVPAEIHVCNSSFIPMDRPLLCNYEVFCQPKPRYK